MAICYNRLWKLLIDKGLKKTDLKAIANISNSTLAKLGKGEYVSMEIIERLCRALDCNVEDIMEITSEVIGQ
jgi:DNA-binding Xre family transcriptional regulator